jgi:hypothetical protein
MERLSSAVTVALRGAAVEVNGMSLVGLGRFGGAVICCYSPARVGSSSSLYLARKHSTSGSFVLRRLWRVYRENS